MVTRAGITSLVVEVNVFSVCNLLENTGFVWLVRQDY